MLAEITIKNYRCFSEEAPAKFVIGKGFTAFVGMNNSGKSSLLKFFFEFRTLFQMLGIQGNVAEAFQGRGAGFSPASVADRIEIFADTNDRDIEILIRPLDAVPDPPDLPIPTLAAVVHRSTSNWSAAALLGEERVSNGLQFQGESGILIRSGTAIANLQAVLATCAVLGRTLYVPPFRNVVNVGSKTGYYDITIGQAFVEQWRHLKTGATKASKLATFRLTQDIKSIFDFEQLEINPSDDTQTLQLFADGRSYSLAEMGSGMAEFIVVLSNAAIKPVDIILIDEPESHLHPSLQLDFLTSLAAYAKEGLAFATHNIGLARSSGARMYSLRRNAKGYGEMSTFGETANLPEFLGEMSFAGYRALGYDNVLLVEGQTDIAPIQQLLRIYKKDHKVVPLPLRGSTLIKPGSEPELQAVLEIAGKPSALIDSERHAADEELDSNRRAFLETCEKLRIDCHVMERRALENYFTDRAVKVVVPSSRALQPYEARSDVQNVWAKEDNWRVAREMTERELEATDLADFFKRL